MAAANVPGGAYVMQINGLTKQIRALESTVRDLQSKRRRTGELGEDEQRPEADGLANGTLLEAEGSLYWRHLTKKGCDNESCPFIHMDQHGMGWCPSV